MSKETKIVDFPDREPAFRMFDVGRKRVTRRRAIACGRIIVGAHALQKIKEKALPKGDVLALAEIAGITGAKRTPDLLPMCHSLPLDQVTIHCIPREPDAVDVYCQATAHAKTGVEMEAVMGVQAALATIWDLVKGTEPNLLIGDIKLLVKEGGKNGLWVNPDGIPKWLEAQLPQDKSLTGVKAALLVMSDRASKGDYEDKSGELLKELLEQAGAELNAYDVIPDQVEAIEEHICKLCDKEKPDLLLASGGTGPGPRDVTPEAVEALCDRLLGGLGELLRRESAAFTDTAWLSRMSAGMRGSTLIITFPGSPKAVRECWEIIVPFLGDALSKIASQGYKKEAS